MPPMPEKLRVKGRRIERPMTVDRPGRAPMTMPAKVPMNTANRFIGRKTFWIAPNTYSKASTSLTA